jgi:hypothetical protein
MKVKILKSVSKIALCLTAVFMMTSCSSSTKAGGELTLGETQGNKYTNTYFGMELTIPNEMTQETYEQVNEALLMSGAITEEEAALGKTPEDVAKRNMMTLVSMRQFPEDSEKQCILAVTTYKKDFFIELAGNENDTPVKLLESMKADMSNSGGAATAGDVYDKKFGKITFKALDANIKYTDTVSFDQSTYAAEINGYFVTILTTTSSDNPKDVLNKALNSIKFN